MKHPTHFAQKTFWLLCLILALASATSSAQEHQLTLKELVANSTFVFEGTPVSTKVIKTEDGRYHDVTQVKVLKGFKGELHPGFIEVFTNANEAYIDPKTGEMEEVASPSHGRFNLRNAKTMIFFGSRIKASNVEFPTTTNNDKVNLGFTIEYLTNSPTGLVIDTRDLNLQLDSFPQLYKLIEKETGSSLKNFAKGEGLDMVRPKPAFPTYSGGVKNRPSTEEREKARCDSARANRAANKPKQKQNSGPSASIFSTMATGTISWVILNQQVTASGSERFLEFDVAYYTDAAGRYAQTLAYKITFNTSTFGSNTTIDATTTFTGNYNNPAIYFTNASILSGPPPTISAGTFNISNNQRVLIPTTPTVFSHIKVKYQGCGETDIALLDDASYYLTSQWTSDPNLVFDPPTTPAENFQTYDEDNTITKVPCVSSFSPNPISAGTGTTLSINGAGFGTSGTNSAVAFLDGNSGSSTYYPIPPSYITSWSNTQIQVVLPDEYTPIGTSLIITPGSGSVQITNNIMSPVIPVASLPKLDVEFVHEINNAGTHRYAISKHSLTSLPAGETESKEFILHSSLANNVEAIAAIKAALREWSCQTGINWRLSGTPSGTISPVSNDGKNVISLINSLPSPIAAYTHPAGCTNGTGAYVLRDTDIELSTAITWSYNIPNGNFYKVLLHELGHAHGLGHVRENPITSEKRIMHYAIGLNYDLTSDDIQGGNAVIDFTLANFTLTLTCNGEVLKPTNRINSGPTSPCLNSSTGRPLHILGVDISMLCPPGLSSNGAKPILTPHIEGGTPPYTIYWTANNNHTTLDNHSFTRPTIMTNPNGNTVAYRLTVADNAAPVPNVRVLDFEFTLSNQGYNLAMRDAFNDPYYYGPPGSQHYNYPWVSPDIINRRSNGGDIDVNPHQDPEYFGKYGAAGTLGPNYLQYRIRNIGCEASPNTNRLRLYWTLARVPEQWPTHWLDAATNEYNGERAGGEITDAFGNSPQILPAIPPGGIYKNQMTWYPPRPQNFGMDPATGNDYIQVSTCVLARVEAPSEPSLGLNEVNGDVERNILVNNEIASRNMFTTNVTGRRMPGRKFETLSGFFTTSASTSSLVADIRLTLAEPFPNSNDPCFDNIIRPVLIFSQADYDQITPNLSGSGYTLDNDIHGIILTSNLVELYNVEFSQAGQMIPFAFTAELLDDNATGTFRFDMQFFESGMTESLGGNSYVFNFQPFSGYYDDKRAMFYDGEDDFCIREEIQDYSFLDGAFSIEAKITHVPKAANEYTILSRGDGSSGFRYFLHKVEPGVYDLALTIGGNTYYSDRFELDESSCYNTVVTRDIGNGDLTFYLNGTEIGIINSVYDAGDAIGYPLIFGADGQEVGTPYSGIIDEVRLWAYNLSSNEVGAHNETATNLIGDENSLMGYWDFEDTDVPQQSYDVTTYANHAQIGSTEFEDDNDPLHLVFDCAYFTEPRVEKTIVNDPKKGTKKDGPQPLRAKVYPNPTHSIINIELDGLGENTTVSLIEINGGTYFTEHLSNQAAYKRTLGENLPKGIYILKVVSDKQTRTIKVIKQ